MAGGSEGRRTESRVDREVAPPPAAPAVSPTDRDGDLSSVGADRVSPQPDGAATRESTAAAAAQAAEAARATAESVHAQRTDWSGMRAMLPLFISGLPALLTLIALAFSLFPWLEPTPPPEVRSVTITELMLGERNKELGDGRTANLVYFEVETVGYDAEDIAVDWLVFDAMTQERLAEVEEPKRWGVIDIGTRSDRVVGEIEIPPPANHEGCVFVRVLLQPHQVADETPEQPGTGLLLDVADTPPFHPYDPTNASCPQPAVAEEQAT